MNAIRAQIEFVFIPLAVEKAALEYNKFHGNRLAEPTQVEKDFVAAEEELLKIADATREP